MGDCAVCGRWQENTLDRRGIGVLLVADDTAMDVGDSEPFDYKTHESERSSQESRRR